jgi:hypothetical protein
MLSRFLAAIIAHRREVVPSSQRSRGTSKSMVSSRPSPILAALIRASQTWQRIVISEFELKQIEELCAELDDEFKQRHEPVKNKRILSSFIQQE